MNVREADGAMLADARDAAGKRCRAATRRPRSRRLYPFGPGSGRKGCAWNAGARLTALRRQVLAMVWLNHQPRGAYAILEDLGHAGRRAAPLTVYRALDFLVGQGLVHRIESLNAFVGCNIPGQAHNCQFLVCDSCGTATELSDPEVQSVISASVARPRALKLVRPMIELHGVCQTCQAA